MGTPRSSGGATSLARLVRDFLNQCRARNLSVKTIETYRPRLERQFLPWAEAGGISEIGQLDQRAIERYRKILETPQALVVKGLGGSTSSL